METTSTVAIVKGSDRYQNIFRALSFLSDELSFGNNILIKPNFVSTKVQLAATHVDALRAVIDFIRERTDKKIIIAEGAATSDTFEGYRHFAFLKLSKRYSNIEFKDLNKDEFKVIALYDRNLNPQPFRISKTVLSSNCRISLTIPKTHDTTIATLSLKNMAIGSLIRDTGRSPLRFIGPLTDRVPKMVPARLKPFFSLQGLSSFGLSRLGGSDKARMHQGYLNINLFLYQLGKIIPPHLSILDGFEAMEGDGPVHGDKVDWGIAIAGADFVATDSVAATLMGFSPEDIGHIYFCKMDGMGEGDMKKVKILGNPLSEYIRPFKPHQSYAKQLGWKKDGGAAFKKLKKFLSNFKSPSVFR